MTQEALKLALDALNDLSAWNDGEVGSHMDEPYAAEVARRTITAIKEALAQTQEPQIAFNAEVVGYVAPQRTWVGLTDEEENEYNYLGPDMHWVIQEISAILKEKNT